MSPPSKKRIGIAGCGTIGQKVAAELDQSKVQGATLVGMTSRSQDKANAFVATLTSPVPVVPLQELVQMSDIVVEAATGAALEEIAITTLKAGKDLMALSGGALLDRQDIYNLAAVNGATIYVPSGAIAGLDGVVSASAGRIDSVTMTTRKPPGGLKGAPGVANLDFDLDTLQEPRIVYEGPTAEACKLFPANVNVSAALSMAGIGPDKTTIRIYADPTVTKNTHEIVVEGEFGRLAIKIENTPSSTNPRTGVLSALSAIASLKKLTSPLQIGT